MFSIVKKTRFWMRSVFGFSQTETTGFLTLTLLMILLLFGALLINLLLPSTDSGYATDMIKLDSLIAVIEKTSQEKNPEDKPAPHAIQRSALMAFDPNQVDAAQWQAFGLPKYLAERITKYKEKGGKFKTKKDLLKIYGFPQPLFDQLYAYIQLPDSIIHDKKIEKHEYLFTKETPDTKKYPLNNDKKELKLLRFNLNSADTTQLKLITGIGPALSKRIIKYRDLLGGFSTTEQIHEIYGLDSTVVNELLKYGYVPENTVIKKININTATIEELDAHPYITPKVAKVIVAYRQQHGKFSSIEGVYEVRILDKNTLTKLAPYLSFE